MEGNEGGGDGTLPSVVVPPLAPDHVSPPPDVPLPDVLFRMRIVEIGKERS
jgi:hypothetical protein